MRERTLVISGVLLLPGWIRAVRRNGRKEREYADDLACQSRSGEERAGFTRTCIVAMRVNWRAAVTHSDGGGRSFRRLLAAPRDTPYCMRVYSFFLTLSWAEREGFFAFQSCARSIAGRNRARNLLHHVRGGKKKDKREEIFLPKRRNFSNEANFLLSGGDRSDDKRKSIFGARGDFASSWFDYSGRPRALMHGR